MMEFLRQYNLRKYISTHFEDSGNYAATLDARQALVRILQIMIGIVTGVTEECVAVIASLFSLAVQLVHNETTHN